MRCELQRTWGAVSLQHCLLMPMWPLLRLFWSPPMAFIIRGSIYLASLSSWSYLSYLLLKSWQRPSWPHNFLILHTCKIVTVWMMPKSSTNPGGSQTPLDHDYRGFNMPKWLKTINQLWGTNYLSSTFQTGNPGTLFSNENFSVASPRLKRMESFWVLRCYEAGFSYCSDAEHLAS